MLSVLVWIPFIAAMVVAFWPQPQDYSPWPRRISTLVAIAMLVWSLVLTARFDFTLADLQFQKQLIWLERLGLTYHLGLDGLSLPLIVLNSLLIWLTINCTNETIQRPRLYYSLLLLIEGGVAGAFLAQDLLLFFLFYEVELIPLYLMIAIWGGARRGYASTKFLIYTAVSGVLLVAAFFGIVFLSDSPSFAYEALRDQTLPLTLQIPLLILLLLAFGIKIPLAPFHTWLPDAHVEASTPVSMLLAGVLLKLGTYGLLKFAIGLLPEAWHLFAPALAVWAAISALYGSLSAIVQTDMKKMVAYSSIAHMAYILLAAAAATPLSLLGAMCQMVSHGLISALLFFLVGIVYKTTGSRDLEFLRGLLAPERGLPIAGSLMILGVMASSGIPGMLGFIAEFMVFRGSFLAFTIPTLLCMVSTGLTAVYFLLLVNRVFFGRLTPALANLPRVPIAEYSPAIVLALLIVLFGIQPTWLAQWSTVSAVALAGVL